MSIKEMYPDDNDTKLIYPDATDHYLDDLERVSPFGTPADLATRVPAATQQMIEQIPVSIRTIETLRRRLSYYASVLEVVQRDNPEAIARLSEEEQAIAAELVAHLKPLTPTETST